MKRFVRPQRLCRCAAAARLLHIMLPLGFTLAAPAALAQAWPDRPVQMVVPYAPGGSTDQLARLIGPYLAVALKQSIVIENRPGAGGMLAHGQVARAAADGHTLIITNQADAINSGLQPKMSYDLVKDFAPISNLIVNAYMLVAAPSLAVGNIRELTALAASRGSNRLSYASSGVGTGSHMAGELLAKALAIQMTHIPYKGTGPAATDVTAGHVSMMFLSGATAMPLIRDGKLRALGVSTAKRAPGAGEIATLQELGVANFDIGSWQGLQAPAGTPRAIITRLAGEAQRIMGLPEVRAKLAAGGSEVLVNSPEEFAAFIRADIARWTEVVRSAGIKPE